MNHKIAGLVALSFVLSAGAVAQARPDVKASMTQSIVTHDANGKVVLEPVNTKAPLKPGTVLEYTITAVNGGTDPARNFKLAGKIPAGTAFKIGSVFSSVSAATPEFSLDAGKSWSASPMVRVTTPQGVVQRPAEPTQYQALRWNDAEALPASGRATFTYAVTVK